MAGRILELQDHLFVQMERLGKQDLKGESLKEEMAKSEAIVNVARTIIQNGSLFLNAVKTANEIADSLELSPLIGDIKIPKQIPPEKETSQTKGRRQLIGRREE